MAAKKKGRKTTRKAPELTLPSVEIPAGLRGALWGAGAVFLALCLWSGAEMGWLGQITRDYALPFVGSLLFVTIISLFFLAACDAILESFTGEKHFALYSYWMVAFGVLLADASSMFGDSLRSAFFYRLMGRAGTTVVIVLALGVGLAGFAGKAIVHLIRALVSSMRGRPRAERQNAAREAEPDSRPAARPLQIPEVLEPAAGSEIEWVEPEPEPEPPDEPEVEAVPETVPDAGQAPAAPYVAPTLDLLRRPGRKFSGSSRDLMEQARVLEETLESFSITAKVVGVANGPSVSRYEIQVAPGTKVSRVTALADDIALALACSEVRIEAPIPGKAAIGIEVPNKSPVPVVLRDVLESDVYQKAHAPLTVGLGREINGQAVIADLAGMPHLLIAGATGSGKSVCINSMIMSLVYKSTPSDVKIMMVDPKVVELSGYNGIPHLLAPVVSDPKRAAAALRWATREMERRYALFARAGVRDIERYNEKVPASRLPFIVIIIDELADLMMVARAEVEDAICRLAQMARAAGMHLVIGTQRPSTDVLTGLIKANIPSRISFAVSSQTDSRVILDQGGAEKLLGKGDMLFSPVGLGKPVRIQGAFISNREIEKVVEYLKTQGEPQYVPSLVTEETSIELEEDEDRDALFDDAARTVLEANQASASLLQRRMRVGYARAARLIEELEDAGIVGPADGAKPRQVFRNAEAARKYLVPKHPA
jgi:S-DNA-T family DNA segregation ATPase FtsK/SpoIIIE